jgi:hypothetical protein
VKKICITRKKLDKHGGFQIYMMKNGINIYCRNEDREMVSFKPNVKEIKGPLADLLKAYIKPEHKREFE